MSGVKSSLAILVVAGLLAGCQSKQQEPVRSTSSSGGTSMAPSGERANESNMALVRFINADPSMQTVSAYMDSNQAFSDVSFQTVTPYREVPDGNHTFHLGENASMQAGRNQGGNNENGISESKSLSSGDYYTVVLRPNEDVNNRGNNNNQSSTSNANNNPPAKFDIIKDDFGSPSTDKARIRVIDAAARPGKVDVVQRPKNDKLFSGIDINSSPSYKDIDPGNVTLEVRPDGKNTNLFALPSKTVEAGHYYTVVLTNKGSNGRNLEAVIVEDQYTHRSDTSQGGSSDKSSDKDQDNDRNNDRDNDNH